MKMEWEEQELFKDNAPVSVLGVLGCQCHLEYSEFEFI